MLAEKNLVSEIWKILGGQERKHVTLNNLRIFLLSIMGTFIEPALKREEQNLYRLGEEYYGQFNEHGDLFLEVSEISVI